MKRLIFRKCAAALVAGAMIMGVSANAALDINGFGVVGTIVSGEPSSVANEVGYANKLLSLAPNATLTFTWPSPIGTHVLTTGNQTGVAGSGIVSGGAQDETGNASVPSGWEYVLAKYDGPNGGAVLWYLGGASINLPANSDGLWVNTEGNGFGLSHFTVFNATVPEPSTVIAGALLLLPFAASTVRIMRKSRKA